MHFALNSTAISVKKNYHDAVYRQINFLVFISFDLLFVHAFYMFEMFCNLCISIIHSSYIVIRFLKRKNEFVIRKISMLRKSNHNLTVIHKKKENINIKRHVQANIVYLFWHILYKNLFYKVFY